MSVASATTAAAGAAASTVAAVRTIAAEAATAPNFVDALHHVLQNQMKKAFALLAAGKGKEGSDLLNLKGKVFHVRIEKAANQALSQLDQGLVKEAIESFEKEMKVAYDEGMEFVIRAPTNPTMEVMKDAIAKREKEYVRPNDMKSLIARIGSVMKDLEIELPQLGALAKKVSQQ
jgi:hypothetical protein